MNVLLIAAHDPTRALLAAQLTEIGAHVDAADDLEQGIAALDRALVDLVLVDLRPAGQRIADTLRRIRRVHPGVPLVVVTGHPYVDEVAAAFKAGAQDVLVRPIERDALQATLRAAAGVDEGTTEDDALWRALVRDASALVRRGSFARAERLARQALSVRPERADAYNLHPLA
jgi:two-component system, NtrC family, response regulator GlrR